MYNLTKAEKLEFIKHEVEKQQISAYVISKNTNLTEAGVGKILNGTVKNPHESSIDSILLYLEKRRLESNPTENKVEEPSEKYITTENEIKEAIECQKEVTRLTKEVVKLQSLLRRNNINFVDIFEEE